MLFPDRDNPHVKNAKFDENEENVRGARKKWRVAGNDIFPIFSRNDFRWRVFKNVSQRGFVENEKSTIQLAKIVNFLPNFA